jgi:hypothetical protein
MNAEDRDQEAVAAVLRATPQARVSDDFLARVNARIDETAGWLGLADFRAWTLGLVPAAAVLVLIAILWPSSPSVTSAASQASTSQTSSQTFSPASYNDWQQDVPANALLEAALHSPAERPNDAR